MTFRSGRLRITVRHLGAYRYETRIERPDGPALVASGQEVHGWPIGPAPFPWDETVLRQLAELSVVACDPQFPDVTVAAAWTPYGALKLEKEAVLIPTAWSV